MIWLSVLVASLLFFATLIAWQSLKKKLKKRIWRQVQVDNLVKIKQHKAGPIEVLTESSLLVEFTYNQESFCCQTAFRPDLYNSFKAQQATFILIDPENPKQCYYNACQQTRYAKLWIGLSFALLVCLFLIATFSNVQVA